VRSLESRGITIDAYLRTTGQTPESLQTNARTEAERAVKRELVLEAVAAERELTVSDEEIEELVRTEATQAGEDPDEVLVRLRESGGFEQLRGDLLMRNALDEIAAGVKRIPLELAHAREKLWTPEKEKGGTGMKIWTPGSEEKR
jgi:trigger factor